MKKLLASLLLPILSYTFAAAQPGTLDTSFGGGDGTVAYSNPLVSAGAHDMALQSDGKLVSLTGPTGGLDSTYSLIRINLDGSLDTGFNGTGTRSFQWGFSSKNGWYFGYARAIGIQTIAGTERIVVAGQAPKLVGGMVQTFLRVDRFMLDGSNDSSFGTNGSVYLTVGQAYDIEIQPDQKIVGVTTGNQKVFRLNANGTLDTTFGSGGMITANGALQRLALDTDGSVLVASQLSSGRGNNSTYTIEVRKFRANGTLESTFGTNGAATFGLSNYDFLPVSIAVDALHNVLVGTRAYSPSLDLAAVRFTQNGLVDTGFATNGIYLAGMAANSGQEAGAVIEGDGKILLIGNIDNPTSVVKDAIVIRLNYDGSLDPTFGTAGKSIFDIAGPDYVVGGRGGSIQFDPFCACEKLLIASGNDHLTTFARLNIF
jgi:uncharacterized delta-60 repeat protein